MSQSAPYLQKHDNGKYYIHWTENRVGKRVSTRQTDLAAAKEFLGVWLLSDQQAPTPAGAVHTIEDLWPIYYTKHVKKNVAVPETVEIAWNNLKPFFGSKLVPQVSQDAADDYVTRRTGGQLGRKVKPQTCRKELAYLMACIHFCAEAPQKIIPVSIIEKIKLPDAAEPRDRWLKTDEIQKLLHAAGSMRRGPRLSRGERFLWIALETAARKQAILDLTWDRVDFETNVIHLDVPGRRKTKKGRASVPISKALLPVLERAYAEREGDLVMDNGGAVWATIQYIVIKAGVGRKQKKVPAAAKPKSTGISPHVLRHTAATHMARRGVPLWKIAKILGNTMAMVEKVYAKHCPDDLREAVDMISNGALEAAE